nr:uncharacterized protein LOC112020549 [Quercus suber]
MSWVRSVFLALISRNKFGFVDGSIAEPDSSSSLYNSWSRSNTTVLSWFTNSLSLDLKASVMYINNARDLWIDLKDRLSQGNTLRLFELGKEIAHLAQGSLSVSSYFTKFKTLWDDSKSAQLDAHYKEHVFRFLMGLNDGYGHVISQILMIEPLPSLSKVCSLILQEEKRRNIGQSFNMIQSGDSAAMLQAKRRGNKAMANQVASMQTTGSYGFDPNVHSSFLPGGVHSGFLTGGALQGAGVQSDLASQNHNGHSGGGDSAQTSHQAASVMTSCPSIPHSLPSTSSSPSTSSNFSGNSFWIPPNLSHSIFATQVVDRQAYKSNTWIIDTGATDHMVHYVATRITFNAHYKEHVFRFLMGLNDGYGHVISQILMIEPLPSLSKVCSLILQEEKRRNIGQSFNMIQSSDSAAMLQAKRRGNKAMANQVASMQTTGSYGFDPNVHSGFLPGGVHSGFLTGGALQGAGVQSDLASQNHNGHSGGGDSAQTSHQAASVMTSCPSIPHSLPSTSSSPSTSSNFSAPATPIFLPGAAPAPSAALNAAPSTAPNSAEPEHVILPSFNSTFSILPSTSNPTLKRSTRSHKPPPYLYQYACKSVSTKPHSGLPYDVSAYLDYSHLGPSFKSFVMIVNSTPLDPVSFHQAVQYPEWKAAMDKKIEVLEVTNTWSLVPLPPGKSPIGCKWVYRVKYLHDGSIERYKARLVAKGFTQKFGLNYSETFSPMAKSVSI